MIIQTYIVFFIHPGFITEDREICTTNDDAKENTIYDEEWFQILLSM